MDPRERPSVARLYNALSDFRAIEELPGKLKLEVQSVTIPLTKARKHQLFVKLGYADKEHTTSLTTKVVAGGEYTWFVFCPFLPLLPSLSPGQERSGNLVGRNQQT